MTTKQKAKELVDKMTQTISGNCEHEAYCKEESCQWHGITVCRVQQNEAIQCALIAVEEIIKTLNHDIRDLDVRGSVLLDLIDYWRNVNDEINKL